MRTFQIVPTQFAGVYLVQEWVRVGVFSRKMGWQTLGCDPRSSFCALDTAKKVIDQLQKGPIAYPGSVS